MEQRYKPCPNCGNEVKTRVIRATVELPATQIGMNAEIFIEREYERLYERGLDPKLLVCTHCSWARNA